MLAFPGERSKTSDVLAVEAFISSLDDEQLELRVKDRFPVNLKDAFNIALRLESNQRD